MFSYHNLMQLALFERHSSLGIDTFFVDLVRKPLDAGAWVDYVPTWLSGHEKLFASLMQTTTWRRTTQVLFERTVETPRRVASFPDDGVVHPIVSTIADALSTRYRVRFDRISAALYRGGQDSVAWHRDREYRERDRAVVGIVSLGAPRRFALRPYRRPRATPAVRAAGRVLPPSYQLGMGDLLVMGGTAQRTWEHAVPKATSAAPRISLMFRHHPDALPYAQTPSRE